MGNAAYKIPFIKHSGLINDAINTIASYKIGQLSEMGITKSLESNFWPGHTIVTYPFYDCLTKESAVLEVLEHIRNSEISPLNLYLHVPFCTGICNYCAYAKSATRDNNRKNKYVETVNKEISLWCDQIGQSKIPITSLYIGGGTPTDLPVKSFQNLIDLIRKNTCAIGTEEVEATCEASPETITDDVGKEKLEILIDAGFNRVSIGVQSFSDRICTDIIRRRHNKHITTKAIELAFKVGFENLNIDLMYGLPTQSNEDWLKSLEYTVSLGVPSITLYPFKVKRRSIWMKSLKNGRDDFDWSCERALIFATIAKRYLEQKGYTQNSVYWFTKKSLHNFNQQSEKYSMKNLLGLGCSSYSFLAGCQFFNIYKEKEYIRNIDDGVLPLEVGKILTKREMMKRFLIFGLKRSFYLNQFYSTFNTYPIDEFPILNSLIDMNLVEYSDSVISLTDLGKLFADEIGILVAES